MKKPIKKLSATTTLIVIDVQDGFDDPIWGTRNNTNAETSAESNILKLLEVWRASQRPVIFVRHDDSTSENSPLHPNQVGNALKAILERRESEPVIGKTVNSAFIGTDLEDRLHFMNAKTIVIVGLTTDHCVSTTTRMAGNLGFETFLIADATATFAKIGFDGRVWSAQELHDSALAQMHEEFCTVLETKDLLEMV
jgi:nicotinamidase-related amidase